MKRQSNQNETDKQPISGNYCQNGRNLSFQTELDRHDKLLYLGHLRAGSKRNYPIEMTSLETLLKRADELAQDVIDAWNASAANLSAEFKTLLHKTFLYKATRQIRGDGGLDIRESVQDLLSQASSQIQLGCPRPIRAVLSVPVIAVPG